MSKKRFHDLTHILNSELQVPKTSKTFQRSPSLKCSCEDYTSAPKHVFPGNTKTSNLIIPVQSVVNSDSYLKRCRNQVSESRQKSVEFDCKI